MARVQEIPLRAIDWDDHPFSVLATIDLTDLRESAAAVGLLNPPWLRQKAAGHWQVVTGLKRLKTAIDLGWEAVTVHTLPPETPDSLCLLIALHDNAFTRTFTLGEQVFYIRKLLAHWEEPVVVKKFLPLLGLPASTKYVDRLLGAASLDDPWRPLMASGRLALTAAARLADWRPADRIAALPFFQSLPFSQSMQEEFLEWLELLSRRKGVAAADILSRPELAACLEAPALNHQEKAAAVRRLLKTWVFPRFTAAQAAFDKALTHLGLKQHPRLRVSPPPAFEGPDFSLEIKFRDTEELKKLLLDLQALTDTGGFFDLYKI